MLSALAAASVAEPSPWIAPLITSALIAVISGFFLVRSRFVDNNARKRDMQPPSWSDVYARLDLQDKKIRLMVGIVTAAAEQWPPGAERPTFDQETLDLIAELDDTLVPAKWRRPKRPPKPATS